LVVKVNPPEVPVVLDAVTVAVPDVAMSDAGIEAVSCVLLTNVLVRATPFQLTVVGLT